MNIDYSRCADPQYYIPEFFRILSKPNSRGVSDLVPMKLWSAQEYYIKNRTHRDIILKNRQRGISSCVLALNSHALFTVPYERQVIITHDDETSGFLLSTIQRFHRYLPEEIRPKTDWKSGARMKFPPPLDSYIYIDSAKSDSIGIGHGLTRAHLSEMAKWPSRKEEQLYADISQTVPEGGYITIESTPKGRGGLFYKLYTKAKEGKIPYKVFFFPWWQDISCVSEVQPDWEHFTKEELQLKEHVKDKYHMELSPEQISFRRLKLAEIGDLFYQEFPENDIDCWLSSEMSVFDGATIRRYLQQTQPGRTEGALTIWKDVIGGEKYVVGVDTAGGNEKGDYSVASVIRIRTNEYVARVRAKMPPDMFAQEVIRTGERYNQALIGVERESHGHLVLHILLERNYPNVYYYQDYDALLGVVSSKPGWKTSRVTKPMMISTLGACLRSNDIIVFSENFLFEASGATWDGEKIKRAPGGYDDELDAVMIAEQIREMAPLMDEKRFPVQSYARL